MTILLQSMLILFSILNLCYTIYQIRKSKLHIDDSIFTICFSFILILMSIFPGVVTFVSNMLGFYSASNFVLVFIVFLLILQILKLQTKISVMNEKLKTLNQVYAIEDLEKRKEKKL